MENKKADKNIQKINIKVGSRSSLYNFLARKYFLPELNCGAVSKKYIIEILKKNCKYFRVKRTEISPVYLPLRLKTVAELLEVVEKILKDKNLPPTGLPPDSSVNLSWIESVLFYLDPKNVYFHPETAQDTEEQSDFEIDSE